MERKVQSYEQYSSNITLFFAWRRKVLMKNPRETGYVIRGKRLRVTPHTAVNSKVG